MKEEGDPFRTSIPFLFFAFLDPRMNRGEKTLKTSQNVPGLIAAWWISRCSPIGVSGRLWICAPCRSACPMGILYWIWSMRFKTTRPDLHGRPEETEDGKNRPSKRSSALQASKWMGTRLRPSSSSLIDLRLFGLHNNRSTFDGLG